MKATTLDMLLQNSKGRNHSLLSCKANTITASAAIINQGEKKQNKSGKAMKM